MAAQLSEADSEREESEELRMELEAAVARREKVEAEKRKVVEEVSRAN